MLLDVVNKEYIMTNKSKFPKEKHRAGESDLPFPVKRPAKKVGTLNPTKRKYKVKSNQP